MGSNHTAAKKAEIDLRRQKVATMVLGRYTQRQIADALGVSQTLVHKDMVAIREEWRERRAQDYDGWVAEELASLDRMQHTLWPDVLKGEDKAIGRVLSIMDRRAKLLGLDQPERYEHTVISKDAIEAEIARLEEEMRQRELMEAAADVAGESDE